MEASSPSHAVLEHCQTHWRLARALDHPNTSIPKRPNTVVVQSPGDFEPLKHRSLPKRSADLPMSSSKRVKLSTSIASSDVEEGARTYRASPSNHSEGANSCGSLPLTGLVVFVDVGKIDGASTCEHWKAILSGLGAQVCRSPCIQKFGI
jgi:hypothetical protein